jgi:hypothetical protein
MAAKKKNKDVLTSMATTLGSGLGTIAKKVSMVSAGLKKAAKNSVKAVTKVAAKKKTAAKKAPAKKVAAKKAPAKKTAAKKSPAKKMPMKKTVAKKVAAKKKK